MNRVYWFCPENDIALGHGCSRFTPPRQAALLAHYGAPLMWWMGDAGDYVLVPEAASEDDAMELASWLDDVEHRFGAGPRLVTSLQGPGRNQDLTLMPWGWSNYTIDHLRRCGASGGMLQAVSGHVDAIRMLSHRRSATIINDALAGRVDFVRFGCPNPVGALGATSIREVEQFAADCCHDAFYVKSPWSSSGRGVVRSNQLPYRKLLERCDGIIASQGMVMLERAFDKVLDFAMLFKADDQGNVAFHGYSQFFNERGTAYGGNLIASDEHIKGNLAGFLPVGLLDDIRDALLDICPSLISGHYTGFFGVDMMIARNGADGSFFLVPCVELNLRMTMGVVAHSLAGQKAFEGARMVVAPARTFEEKDLGKDSVELVPKNPYFRMSVSCF